MTILALGNISDTAQFRRDIILARKGPAAKKSIGQHFLKDKAVVHAALQMAQVQAADTVVEIGPGRGILTKALLDQGAEVVAIELDPRMVQYLEATLANPRLTVIQEDVLKVDWRQLLAGKPQVKVVANLPYYITSPIVQSLLASRELFQNIVLMVQKEVAERIAAEPGGRTYGILSVAVQVYAEVELGTIVPPAAFDPPPEVHSHLINLTPRKKISLATSEEVFFRIVRAAFSQRRKTILNSLLAANLLACQTKADQKEKIAQLLETVDIAPAQRPETISIEAYAALAEAVFPNLKSEKLSIQRDFKK